MRQINRLSSLYSSAPILIFFLLVLISAMGCNMTSPPPPPNIYRWVYRGWKYIWGYVDESSSQVFTITLE